MTRGPKVIVVGAGPVGLTAALLLASKGVQVSVLETNAEISCELRASTFHPPTLDMMKPYGITKKMIAVGLKSPTWQIRMHPSGERAVFDLSVLRDDTEHPYRLQCEQSKYCEFVLEALRALPEASVRFSASVENVHQNDDGVSVLVRIGGADEQLRADYVIGCDGARSVVRQSLGIELSGDVYPETSILATTHFPFHERLEGLSNVSYCWKPGGTFSLLRLPEVWRVSLYPRQGQTVEQALEPEVQQELLHEIVPDADRIEILQTRPYRIHRRLAASYGCGRVFLAGDAAHLNSPSGGMGMNGGIHDAFSLCEKLIAVTEGADSAILQRYERQRRPIAEEEIIAQAHRNRTRMQERNDDKRRAMLDELKRTVDDPIKLKAYLLKSSMIEGLRRAEATA